MLGREKLSAAAAAGEERELSRAITFPSAPKSALQDGSFNRVDYETASKSN
jgi:hypothetical protein